MIEWKDIYGYELLYKVSSEGEIKREYKYSENKIVKPIKGYLGYTQVCLSKNNDRKCFAIHRLVAISFIPNPSNKPQVNHINGIKTDNRVENLEWCTAGENVQHAYNIGMRIITENHSMPPRKVGKYDKLDNLIDIYESISDACKNNKKTSSGNISGCCLEKYGHKTSGGFIWKYLI